MVQANAGAMRYGYDRRIVVVGSDVVIACLGQFANGVKRAAADSLARDFGEPTLHLIEPAPLNHTLVKDCLIYEAPRQRMDRSCRPETLMLDHADKGEVLDRIDPEPRTGDAEPTEGAVRDGIACGSGIHHDLKVHAPPGARRHGLEWIGIDMIGANHFNCARRQQADTIQLSTL